MTDERLMERLLEGEEQALDTLVKRYQGPLYGFAFRMLSDKQAAEDAFQDTFLRVYRRRFTYKRDAKFKPWVFQICLNICRDHLRKKKRRTEVALTEVTQADDAPGPEERATGTLEAERLHQAIEKLPEKQRQVLILSHFKSLSYPEIAETLNIPAGTVKSRVFHALKKLGSLLGSKRTNPENS